MRFLLFTICTVLLLAQQISEAAEVPPAADVLGFDPAGRGQTVDSTQVRLYTELVAKLSDRVETRDFGLSTDGRPLTVAIVSSPENLARLPLFLKTLDRIKQGDASQSTGKLCALITCGIHPNEVGSTAVYFPILHRLAVTENAAYRKLLDNVVLLLIPCVSPDGTDRIAQWLRVDPARPATAPFLYHRYCGHDLNRDWLLGTQAEARALIHRIHNRFLPWVTMDVHQTGRYGPRLFIPPYADPVDPALDDEIRRVVNKLGDHVFDQLIERGRTGVARRWLYDAWTPARAYSPYHGGIRFLLEGASSQYTDDVRVSPDDLWVFGVDNSATPNYPTPWTGGTWGLPEVTDLFETTIESVLFALLKEPFRSGQQAYFRDAETRGGAVLLETDNVDTGIVGELLSNLSLTGARLTSPRPGRWIAADPTWGNGWCRSLLLCSQYPVPEVESSDEEGAGPRQGSIKSRETFNPAPYDTSTHNLAMLAGLKASSLSGAASTVSVPRAGGETTSDASQRQLTPPGRLQPLPSIVETNAAWVLSQKSLKTFKELTDLVEAGVQISRVSRPAASERWTLQSGDFVLKNAHRDWIERLCETGADAIELNQTELDRIEQEAQPIRFEYPQIHVLRGPTASKDEGWLRWVLEEYRFRFRRLQLDDTDNWHDVTMSSRPDRGRPVLILAEGTLRRPRVDLGTKLASLVNDGWRVIALGGAANAVVLSSRLPVSEVYLDSEALPGTLLRSAFPSGLTRNSPARGRVLEATFWGYDGAPAIFYDRGPMWKRSAVPFVDDLLLVHPADPRLCGILGASSEGAVRGSSALVRIKSGSQDGEWLLCGFSPHYRAWTLGTFRLLFNMILAP